MEGALLSLLLVGAGVVFLVRNIMMLRDPKKLRRYLETSPKARLWVNKLGIERTVTLSRRVFLPLGMVIACVLAGVGLWRLTRTL